MRMMHLLREREYSMRGEGGNVNRRTVGRGAFQAGEWQGPVRPVGPSRWLGFKEEGLSPESVAALLARFGE
jgi:hypothetical protein